MLNFSKSIFEMRETVIENKKFIRGLLYLKTATTSAVKEISNSILKKFMADVKGILIKCVRAIKIDEAHLKMQGKSYYYFTLRFMEIVGKGPFVHQQYHIHNVALLFAQAPDQPYASNIKRCLNDAITPKYEFSMEHFSRSFTTLPDGTTVIERAANVSISKKIHAPSETWLKCMTHALKNVIKYVLVSYCNSKILEAVKRVFQDANRVGWNHLLPNGCRLVQESETRFGTHYRVAERFVRSACFISELVETRLCGSEQTAYRSLKKTSNIDGTTIGYPGIESLFDGFGIVVDCIERF